MTLKGRFLEDCYYCDHNDRQREKIAKARAKVSTPTQEVIRVSHLDAGAGC